MSQNYITAVVENDDVCGLNINPAWAMIHYDNNASKLYLDWRIIYRLIAIREHEKEKQNAISQKD